VKCVLLSLFGLLCVAGAAEARQANARPAKFTLQLDGAFRATSTTFDDSATPTINAEPARIDVAYGVPRAAGFSIGGSARAWKRLSIGAGFERLRQAPSADITASLPHPFAFSRHREIQGTASALGRSESAVSLHARYDVPMRSRVGVALFAGPTWISVNQQIVDAVNYDDAYPYDTAAYRSASLRSTDSRAVGLSLGADVSYFVSRQIGLGFGAKYSRASAEFNSLGGTPITFDLGGLSFTGGLRVRF
jgi:opacity protein-like surface antigen